MGAPQTAVSLRCSPLYKLSYSRQPGACCDGALKVRGPTWSWLQGWACRPRPAQAEGGGASGPGTGTIGCERSRSEDQLDPAGPRPTRDGP